MPLGRGSGWSSFSEHIYVLDGDTHNLIDSTNDGEKKSFVILCTARLE